MDPISNTKKMVPSGTYPGRELLSMLEGIIELNQFEADDQVIKKNKLKGITEMIINLDELNNSNNLKDGHPSNTLFMYHVDAIKILCILSLTSHSTRPLETESLLP